MDCVWVILKDEGYGYHVDGVCSSKEKADAFIAAYEEMYGHDELKVVSCRIDEILETIVSDIRQSLGYYEKLKMYLDVLKKES